MKFCCKYIKSFFKQNQDKIALCAGVILIALISFGLGRLSYDIGSKPEPIEIIDADIFKPIKNTEIIGDTIEQNFVGSKNSNLYHLPDCSAAKKIKKENEIWFTTKEGAEKRGYKPHSCVSHK